MIWFRRVIALPLALVFIVLFIVLLVVGRVNGTVGNPDFYADQLRRADVYNFLYDELLPAALEEVEVEGGEAELPLDFAVLEPHIIDFARQTLPPQWLQAQAEAAIGEIVPYAVGDTGHFILSLSLKDRVAAGTQAAKDMLHQEDVFGSIYDAAIAQVLVEGNLAEGGLPEPFALDQDELETVILTVIPEDWVLAQIDGAIDEFTPYLIGDEAHFVVVVDVADRLDALEPVAADILARQQTYDYIYDSIIAPAALQGAGEFSHLPVGSLLTEDDITAVLKDVLPLEWYRVQSAQILADVFAYLRGERATVQIVIPVADRKPVAAAAVTELVDRKLVETFDVLPSCTAMQLLEIAVDPLGHFPPECRPLDISYAEIKELFGIDIGVLVAPALEAFLPDEFVIADAELRQMLTTDGEEDLLTQGRDVIQNGFTYSDADLREALGEEYTSLQDVREIIAEGLSYSDEDLRQNIVEAGGVAGGEVEWQRFQALRASIGLGRSLFWLAWLVPVLLLAGIGFLGGRNWRSRAIWAAAVLALAAALVYIAFGPVFSVLADPVIAEAFMAGTELDGIEGIALAKGMEIAENSISSFVGGINIQALIVLGVAVAGIVLAALWPRFFGSVED